MQPKYTRLFLVDTQFRSRMLAAAVLLVLIVTSGMLIGPRRKALDAAKKEKELVLNIPIMEKLYASKTQVAPVRPVEVEAPEGELVLEGTYVKNGVPYALINGTILSKGDIYGDYVIMKVEFGTAVLSHRETKEQKILQFFYYEE